MKRVECELRKTDVGGTYCNVTYVGCDKCGDCDTAERLGFDPFEARVKARAFDLLFCNTKTTLRAHEAYHKAKADLDELGNNSPTGDADNA